MAGEPGHVRRDLVDDLLFQLTQLSTRREPDLGELTLESPKRSQCLHPPAIPCKGVGEQMPRALSVGVFGDECLEHGNRPGMASEHQISLEPDLDHGAAELDQPGGRRAQERKVAETPERRPAPQLHPLDTRIERRLRIMRQQALGLDRKPLESNRIDDIGRELQGVAVVLTDEMRSTDRRPDPRDVRLQIGLRRLGHLVAPHVHHEPIDRNGVPDVDRQRGEQCQRAIPPDVHSRAVHGQLDRAEDPDIDGHVTINVPPDGRGDKRPWSGACQQAARVSPASGATVTAERRGPSRKERIVTLTREPVVQERPEALREQEIQKVERPPVAPPSRIRWFEWALGIVLVAAVALAATLLMTQTTAPDAESTLVLGPRHDGVVFVPEFVGASGGDLPAIESSPLVLGVRQLDGVVFVPEYVGASGGELPAVESSPLVIGPRHTDGVVFVPVYVGTADGVFPETTR